MLQESSRIRQIIRWVLIACGSQLQKRVLVHVSLRWTSDHRYRPGPCLCLIQIGHPNLHQPKFQPNSNLRARVLLQQRQRDVRNGCTWIQLCSLAEQAGLR